MAEQNLTRYADVPKFRNDHYEVKESAPRINVHADLLSTEEISKRYPSGPPGGLKNLFVMVLLEKNIEYVLSCDMM